MGRDMHQLNAWMDDHLFRLVQLVWIDRISCRSFVDPSLTYLIIIVLSSRPPPDWHWTLRHLANDRAGHLGPDGRSALFARVLMSSMAWQSLQLLRVNPSTQWGRCILRFITSRTYFNGDSICCTTFHSYM